MYSDVGHTLIGKLRNSSKFARAPLCGDRLVVEFMRGDGRVGRVEGEGVEPNLVTDGLGMGEAQWELITDTVELCA